MDLSTATQLEGPLEEAVESEDAAVVIEAHPIALQLRYLQTLLELGPSASTTIVFPAPVDILAAFMPKGDRPAS